MRRLVYVLQFHRPPRRGPGDEPPTLAPGLTVKTVLTGGSVQGALQPLAGGEAKLDLEYTLDHSGRLFFEAGTATFGGAGSSSLSFSSVGTGSLLGDADEEGFTQGVVSWLVESGTGALAGATGAISSNFLVNLETEELIDNHLGVIALPGGEGGAG